MKRMENWKQNYPICSVCSYGNFLFVMIQCTSLACLNVVATKQEVKDYLPYTEGTPF